MSQLEQAKKELLKEHHDPVNHPSHYCSHPSGIECIEITRHHCFSVGNAIKYMWRAGLKDPSPEKEIEDLKKAIWYLQDRISQLEQENKNGSLQK
jgi:hypothetical protein